MRRILYIIGIAAISAMTLLMSQTTHGNLAGTVKSASGNPIANATITATNTGTNAPLTVLSGPDGKYIMNHLPQGKYRVDAAMAGFKPLTRDDVMISAGASSALDLTLEPGDAPDTAR
jgi:hypothetical protein